MKRFAVMACAILLASCQQSSRVALPQSSQKELDQSANLIVVDEKWHFAEHLEVEYALALEEPQGTVIGMIKKVEENPRSGQLYVLEYEAKSGIFIFDSEGRYLNAFAREGEGPGEGLQIKDFCLNEDRILVASTLKVMLFDQAGNLIAEKNKGDFAKDILFGNIRSVSAYKQGFLIHFDSSPSGRASHDLCYIDAELNLMKGFHTPDLRTRVIPYGSSHVAVNEKNQVAVLDVFGFRMELFNSELELETAYIGWPTPIDFEEAKKKVNLRKMATALAFLEQSNMPLKFYHWQGKFISATANMQTKRSKLVVVDPQNSQLKAFPGLNAETETPVDRLLFKARPINDQHMATIIYECQDWEAFKQAYPDLLVTGAQAAECPDLIFLKWNPNAFD